MFTNISTGRSGRLLAEQLDGAGDLDQYISLPLRTASRCVGLDRDEQLRGMLQRRRGAHCREQQRRILPQQRGPFGGYSRWPRLHHLHRREANLGDRARLDLRYPKRPCAMRTSRQTQIRKLAPQRWHRPPRPSRRRQTIPPQPALYWSAVSEAITRAVATSPSATVQCASSRTRSTRKSSGSSRCHRDTGQPGRQGGQK